MDSFREFEELKYSALSKLKLVNQYCTEVTIGPNSSPVQHVETATTINDTARDEPSEQVKTPIDTHSNWSNYEINYRRSPITRIRAEINLLLKDEIEVAVKSRLQKIEQARQQHCLNAELEWERNKKTLISTSEKQEQLLQKVLEEHDKKSNDNQLQLQLQNQKQAEERAKRNQEIQLKERQQHFSMIITAIQQQHHTFQLLYRDILGVLQKWKDQDVFQEHKSIVKALVDYMGKVREKCKAGTVTDADCKVAVTLVQKLAKMKEIFIKISAKLEADQVTLVIPQSPERPVETKSTPIIIAQPDTTDSIPVPENQPEEQKPLSMEKTIDPVEELKPNPVDVALNKKSFKTYLYYMEFLEAYQANFEDLAKNPKYKKLCFNLKKAVNLPLNSISAINSQHLHDKYQKLASLLSGKTVKVGEINVSAKEHPQGIAYCTFLLAKMFVLQGDLLISSKPESAHCYAAVIVALWMDFHDFGRLILANFYKIAPTLIPYYPSCNNFRTPEEYLIILGFHFTDGVLESQDKFFKRMSGTARLYAAITITKLKRGQSGSHPQGLECSWRWLSQLLNMEPRMDLTAIFLYEFLSEVGHSLYALYGKQFEKIIAFINTCFLEKIMEMGADGPVIRLQILLQKIAKTGHIDAPKGILPEGFW